MILLRKVREVREGTEFIPFPHFLHFPQYCFESSTEVAVSATVALLPE